MWKNIFLTLGIDCYIITNLWQKCQKFGMEMIIWKLKRIIIVKDNIKRWRDDKGIVIMGITDFLLDEDSLNYKKTYN